MVRVHQLIFQSSRTRKSRKLRSPPLRGNPQRRAVCVRVFITTPRKPNSAKRKVARVEFYGRPKKKTTISIPGKGHNLKKHSKVMIRGGNVRDIPSVRCRAMRGKLDLEPWVGRKTARSKYGIKKSKNN